MRVTVVNVSHSIHSTEFHAAVAAIGKQAKEDFDPAWNISSILRGVTHNLAGKAPIEGLNDALIYLGDSSQDPTTGVEGALGYHSANHKDIPYGFVYLDICSEYGEEWTTTLSHEVLELLGDPAATLTVSGPDPRKATRRVQFDLEVCDPTQGDAVADELLRRGADPNAPDLFHQTPLHLASSHRHYADTVRTLLGGGALATARDDFGRT